MNLYCVREPVDRNKVIKTFVWILFEYKKGGHLIPFGKVAVLSEDCVDLTDTHKIKDDGGDVRTLYKVTKPLTYIKKLQPTGEMKA